MSEELAVQSRTITVAEPEPQDVHLVARSAEEMQQSRDRLANWLRSKIKTTKYEAVELVSARDMAIKQKWGNATLKRHADLAMKRVTFYEKVLAAVDAGFTIVPNFPVDMFAVRTGRLRPMNTRTHSSWGGRSAQANAPAIKPQMLPSGEGQYVNPHPSGSVGSREIPDGKGGEKTTYYFDAENFSDIQFPIECAIPEVMGASAQAMALKVFDEIGICRETRTKPDPLIIGRVLLGTGWAQKSVSFLIAWHLDLRTL